ncbi:MAG: putative toxin-antitoxin system toxin component, PIN family [Bacteroidetes bacterium]|nr:putative toxin-antitoxin system toxin component, PIN family [Bacteroidota bacterium]
MRVNNFVLDCNAWLRFLLPNKPDFILDVLEYFPNTKIYSCQELIDEIEDVLHRSRLQKRYNINHKKVQYFIKDVTHFYTLSKPIKRRVPNDEKDDYILALAIETNSSFIVSDDRHLQSLKKAYPKINFITKEEFVKVFSEKIKKLKN